MSQHHPNSLKQRRISSTTFGASNVVVVSVGITIKANIILTAVIWLQFAATGINSK